MQGLFLLCVVRQLQQPRFESLIEHLIHEGRKLLEPALTCLEDLFVLVGTRLPHLQKGNSSGDFPKLLLVLLAVLMDGGRALAVVFPRLCRLLRVQSVEPDKTANIGFPQLRLPFNGGAQSEETCFIDRAGVSFRGHPLLVPTAQLNHGAVVDLALTDAAGVFINRDRLLSIPQAIRLSGFNDMNACHKAEVGKCRLLVMPRFVERGERHHDPRCGVAHEKESGPSREPTTVGFFILVVATGDHLAVNPARTTDRLHADGGIQSPDAPNPLPLVIIGTDLNDST